MKIFFLSCCLVKGKGSDTTLNSPIVEPRVSAISYVAVRGPITIPYNNKAEAEKGFMQNERWYLVENKMVIHPFCNSGRLSFRPGRNILEGSALKFAL